MEAIEEYLKHPTPDYKEGLRLLEAHHRNRNLVQQLGRKENASGWAKLRYELAKLAGNATLAVLDAVTQPLLDVPSESTADLARRYQELSRHLNECLPDGEEYQATVEELEQVKERLHEAEAPLADDAPEPSVSELAATLMPEALAEVEDLTNHMATVYQRKVAASNSLADVTSRADRQRVVDAIQQHEDEYNTLAEQKRLVTERGTPTPPPAEETDDSAPEPNLAELMRHRSNLSANVTKARKKAETSKTAEKQAEYAQKAAKLTMELSDVDLRIKQLRELQQPGPADGPAT